MYKVLLVDDEILVREAISAKIEWNRLGFELAGDCDNGKAAIEFLEKTPVDVVLTDICMPYIDGMGLSKYLYENRPSTVIIIFSGYNDFEYAKQAIQYQVSEYLLKPVTAQELTEVLTRIRGKLDSERSQEEKNQVFEKAFRMYTKNEALIISRTLSRLVQGTQAIETSLDELVEFGIEVKGKAFRVVVMDIDIFSPFCDTDEDLKKESALMSFAVENISYEIVSNHRAGITYQNSDSRVCMLLWTNSPGQFQKEALDICREIQEAVKTAMNLTVSMGIGCCVDNLKELPRSYEEAEKTLRYCYAKGNGQIYDCEESTSCTNVMELEQDFQEIEEAVRGNRVEELFEILEHVETWISHGFAGKAQVTAWLQQIMRIIYEQVHRTNETFLLYDEELVQLTEAKNLREAMELVKAYARRGMEAMEEAGQTSGERLSVLALDYIKENYSNCSLGLTDVCEYLNISTSRFSSVFKEATGKTFTEVLNGIRMERAKQLLKETSMKNYEIAEKVGFSDPHYFSIAFKKMTGKTPKEYAGKKQ